MAETHKVPITSVKKPVQQPSPAWASGRGSIFFIQIVYLLALGGFVIAYRVGWIDPRRDFFGPVPFLVPWFGAVGAVLLSLKGVFDHPGVAWNPNYCYWHWSRPLVGGVVSTVSVLIFQSGILAVGGKLPEDTQATTKNLLYYLVAFVVGYREDTFRQLIQRLADVVFTPPEEPGAAPVIESVDPAEVAAGQQTDAKIVGSGFTGATSVKLGGESIQFVAESDTQMTVTVPAAAKAARTSLVITNARGTATTSFTIT
jgi:hypothetical protein